MTLFRALSIVICLFSTKVYAHSDVTITQCDGVSGLKIFTDYSSDNVPFKRLETTPLYTTYSDEYYFNYIVLDNSKFPASNIEIHFDILNRSNETIKKNILNTWTLQKSLPGKKIIAQSLTSIINSQLVNPIDSFRNLSNSQRSRVDISKLPYDAKFSIGYSGQPPFCTFSFKYGSEVL